MVRRLLTLLIPLLFLWGPSHSAPAPADSTEAFESRENLLFSFPRHLWNLVVYPVGEFALHAEHSRLPERAMDLFMNADYTFGVFPQIQLGGETGTGGGVRIFHSNLAGRRKRVEAMFVYSGVRGQTGQFVYHDPALFGSSLFARLHGAYLETDNHAASVNASVRDDPNRVFEITQTDASLSLGWSLHSGTLAGTRPNVSLEATFGHHYRDFRALTGGTAPLTDVGSTPRAASLPGLNEKPSFLSFGGRLILDNRDYRRPLKIPPHPWLGHLPGEVVTFSQGLYHFHRNTSYPRRGGRLLLGGSFATGSEDVRFVHTEAEVQGFLPLFRAGQVIAVRSRLERIFRLDTGTAPYVDLVQLGGGREMRGFRRGFFAARDRC